MSDSRADQARAAFAKGDAAESKRVHASAFENIPISPEEHLTCVLALHATFVHHSVCKSCMQYSDQGTYLKAAVFGGMDGIVTTFAVVARCERVY